MKGEAKKRRAQLMEIESLAHVLIYSEFSSTSVHFHHWCEVHDQAIWLVRLIQSGGLDEYLNRWIPETLANLRWNLFEE